MKATIAALVFLLASPAWARSESWYWGFGLGVGTPTYPAAVQTEVDSVRAAGGGSTRGAVDLGFHWPVGQTTTLGISGNGGTDSYDLPQDVSVTQSGLFATLIHSFGSEPMKGFFLRGDVGLANLRVKTASVSLTSETGFGLIGGAGIAFAVSDETKLVLQANYAHRRVEGQNYNLFAITFGPMF
ncbi:MAG TPA: outer membrane beta-barrel protein [Bdellovibrionota bacterium]|nr:outer membrane beta-barrel protein [Bdellovibrionota bacterium]